LTAVDQCTMMATVFAVLGFASRFQTEKLIYIIRHGEKVDGDSDEGQLDVWNQCLSQKGWTRAYNLKSIMGLAGTPFRTPDYIFSANYAEPLECRDKNGFYRTQQTVSALADSAPGGLSLVVDNTTGFMPSICGLKWNPLAKKPYGELRMSQPEPFKNLSLDWAKAQPEDPSSTCYPYDEGLNKTNDPLGSGMCCNEAAAGKMLAKLAEPGIDTILVAWESHNIQHLTAALGVPKAAITHWDGHNFDSVYVLKYDTSISLSSYDLTSVYQGFDTLGYPPAPVQHYLGPNTRCGAIYPTNYSADEFPLPNVISPTVGDDGKPEYTLNRAM